LISLALGAAYGTVKSGISISSISTSKPDSIIKSLLPVIMAGILSIYGMVVGIFIALQLSATEPVTLFAGSLHLGAGLAVGVACLSSGLAIGAIGEHGIRGYAMQPRFFFGLILLLVFAEVLGIYGFIAAGMLVNITRSYLAC
jgi:V-type H+-transporting ATPase proteolipid subunit